MDTARALSEKLAALLRHEHDAMADFLVALADFDKSRRWAALGHPSLFYYLHRELKLSKAASQYRKVAAELIQEVPAVAEGLRAGHLCLNSVIEVAKVVTAENWETVLPRFHGLSRREAEAVVAELQPHPAPPVRFVVTSIPAAARAEVAAPVQDAGASAPRAEAEPVPGVGAGSPSLSVSSSHEPVRSPAGDAPATPSIELVPLTAQLRRMHVTVSKEFARKLEAAADARPDLEMEQILEAGLDLLLAKAAKSKGVVAKPQKTPRPTKSVDHVPSHVKREVMKRDAGRCQWRLASGELCGGTRQLEFDHVRPLALGGSSTIDNIRLLCRPHNLEAARRSLGDTVMDRYTSRDGNRRWQRP